MAESFVMIHEDYRKVYKVWTEIADSEADEINDDEIICDDMYFEDDNGWCLITTRYGDNFAEEILLQLSAGKKLLYFFSDEDQLDCEFIVIENNAIIRKKYIYYDMPEFDEDVGRLQCENEYKFVEWHDIDNFIEIAREEPESLFAI